MVAANIALPNIRKQFVPDPDYIIVDADLSGADAQVVAWEANDEDLKEAFRKGLKLHAKNARDMYPKEYGHFTDAELKKFDYPGGVYHNTKRIVHGTNYGGKAPTISTILNLPRSEVAKFQARWFQIHPGIADWHDRVELQLARDRTITNKFGNRIVYFERPESILPEALAWIPQSTVALTCIRGMLKVRKKYRFVQMLLQNHDSAVFQVPKSEAGALPEIHHDLHIEIPYDDPLTIPWGFASTESSWGELS